RPSNETTSASARVLEHAARFYYFRGDDFVGRDRLFRVGPGDVRARCIRAGIGFKTTAIASSDLRLRYRNDDCRALGRARPHTRHDFVVTPRDVACRAVALCEGRERSRGSYL